MKQEDYIDKLAKKIWDYSLMHQQLKKADAIIVFGSYNPIVGKRAAELFQQGFAPIVVFSGNRSDSTTSWNKTEAETLADEAIRRGLLKDKILLETKAKNSGENALFTKKLLEKHGIDAKSIIAIQKPYAERRTYATIKKQWPEVEVIVTSPQISYEEYMKSSPVGKSRSISVMVGDLQRIKIYADLGFQIPQEIPADIWAAYEELVKLEYYKSLARE